KARVRTLRQVGAERSEKHVLNAVRITAGGTRPGIADYVGILWSPLHCALRSLIEAIPESESALDDVARITCAVRQCARSKSVASGQRFSRATRVAEHRRTV